MKKFLITLATAAAVLGLAGASQAEPNYAVIKMATKVDRSASETWAKVGKFCDLGTWLKIDCAITFGDGGIGTVRSIAGGRITEIMVAQTDLSYGYTQPVTQGKAYDLYHGFLEARPISATSSQLIYTLFYDASALPDEAARTADINRRRTLFEGALKAMKTTAEAK